MLKLKYSIIFLFGLIILISSCLFDAPQSYNLNVKKIETDFFDYALLLEDGKLLIWGTNDTGLLADSSTRSSKIPQQVEYLDNITAMNLREGAALAADEDGNIWFWGNRLNWNEMSRDSTILLPKTISHITGVIEIETYGLISYLLDRDGNVWKLLWNHFAPTRYITPVQINELSNIIHISGSLALDNNGVLHTIPDFIGINRNRGSLGDSTLNKVLYVQNRINMYTIILMEDSTVWAWGHNSAGVLGDGTTVDHAIPTKINNLKDIISISANSSRCLALDKNGDVWYWGLVELNLDRNIEEYQTIPKRIDNISNVSNIFASPALNSILVKDNGSLWYYKYEVLEAIEIKH